MMRFQVLATPTIIRQIVEPARDFAHTPPIARNHGCRGHRSAASQASSASPKAWRLASWRVPGLRYLVVASALAGGYAAVLNIGSEYHSLRQRNVKYSLGGWSFL